MKSKIFKSKFADINLEVTEDGWIMLRENYNNTLISLGCPENARIELIENAIKLARKLKEKSND